MGWDWNGEQMVWVEPPRDEPPPFPVLPGGLQGPVIPSGLLDIDKAWNGFIGGPTKPPVDFSNPFDPNVINPTPQNLGAPATVYPPRKPTLVTPPITDAERARYKKKWDMMDAKDKALYLDFEDFLEFQTAPPPSKYGIGYYETQEEVPVPTGYESYFEPGKGWTIREIKIPTTPERFPLPAGRPSTIVDAQGNTQGWNTKTGEYDLFLGYTKPVTEKVIQTTEPITKIVDGEKWISGNGGQTWQLVEKDPSTKDYPLPAGQSQSYTDGNGNIWNWDRTKGDYNQAGYNKPGADTDTTEPMTKVDPQGYTWISGNGGKTWQRLDKETAIDTTTGKPYNDYATAKAAADAAGGGYTPVQLSNGLWILQANATNEPPKNIPLPAGQLQTYTDGNGNVYSWDTRLGDYNVTGFDPKGIYKEPTEPPRTYAAPGSTPMPTPADIQAWIGGKAGGGVYNPVYDINKDQQINMGDITALQNQPAGGTGGGAGGSTWTDDGGVIWVWNSNSNEYIRGGYDATRDRTREMTQYQQQQLALQQQQASQSSRAQSDATAQAAANLAWQQQQAQAELDLRKQEHLADLAAHPVNWLQYNSAAGTQAQIQPWMLPLQPGQYGFGGGIQPVAQPTPNDRVTPIGRITPGYRGNMNTPRPEVPNPNAAWQAGQNIPGYNATNMKGMPSLLNPSTQLYSRMAPSMQQQYAGYQQAQTGATPEDTAWLLRNQASPSGRNVGFRYNRG